MDLNRKYWDMNIFETILYKRILNEVTEGEGQCNINFLFFHLEKILYK